MRAALAFLTPLGGAREPTPRALPWFPVVGALVGLGVGGAWWAATEVWTPSVGAAIALAVDLALTGMLHIDGLADSADGLLPHHDSTDRRLEVMAQPDVGAFGVATVGVVLLVRFAAMASMQPRPLVCLAVWGATRGAAALTITSVRYARSSGLASAFDGGGGAGGLIVLVIAVAFALTLPSGVAFLAALGVVALGVRRIGGYTGDVLGAAIVIGETVGLLVAAS